MSATRDTSQKIGWSFSNIYRIHRDKTDEKPVVTAFEPLKSSIQEIERLHSELKLMIEELENLVKE